MKSRKAWLCIVTALVTFLMISPGVLAPTTLDPDTESLVKGSGTWTFPGDLISDNGVYVDPVEADQAVPTDLLADVETITTGTKVSGDSPPTPSDVDTDNGAPNVITYREENVGGSLSAPTFVDVGAILGDQTPHADPMTVGLPATHSIDDILLLLVWVRDLDDDATVSGWTVITGFPHDTTTARQWLFWKRDSGSETDPAVDFTTTTGDAYARIFAYAGAVTSGDPWEVVGTWGSASTNPLSLTGITTLTDNSLVVVPAHYEDNDLAGCTVTGTDPAVYTEHYAESPAGGDGAICVSEAARTTAGVTGAVSVDWGGALSDETGGIVLALKPVVPTNYQLNVQYDWTTETCANTRRLTVNSWHTAGEDFLVQVWDITLSAWNTRITVTATADGTTQTWDLSAASPNEWNSGSPRIRFIGNTETGDASQNDYIADYVVVRCFPAADYELEYRVGWTGETCAQTRTILVSAHMTNAGAETMLLQVDNGDDVWDGSDTTRITITATSDPSPTYQSWELAGGDTGEWDSGAPNVRFLGSTETGDTTQTTLNIDDLEIECADPAPPGDTHNSLVSLTTESPGVNCANGGVRVDSGIDNGDGGGTADDDILQTGEIDDTAYVCHGKNSVTALVGEPPGVNCANGGFKFTSGVDDDADNTLDAGEVDFTGYACNGAAGAPGSPGADGADGSDGLSGLNGPMGPRGPPGGDFFFFAILGAIALSFVFAAARKGS